MCCNKLKKEPFHRFERETGRRPIVGTMAAESKLRETQYLRQGGCNVFGESPASKPLSIWTEADIWEYIRAQNLPIAEIYHKGAARTGCMGCGFGSQFADDTRFDTLLREHPKCYDMIMGYTNNGVSFREAMRKALQVNGRFLPDEEPANLFSIL
jgi:3'-phosphoadenosine 5'-phosphosulfate sulfotransferase (PAPS reductase)/FAD synthetase